MTRNQIEYQKLQETKRSNRAQEDITQSRDLATISARLSELSETERHNKQVEQQAWEDLQIKHEQAGYSATQAAAAWENARSNWENAMTNRMNAETNVVNAQTNIRNAESNARQASAAEANAASNARQAAASERHAEAAIISAGAASRQAETSAAMIPIQAQQAAAAWQQSQAAAANAYTNYYDATTRASAQREQARHNLADESVRSREAAIKEAQTPSVIDLNSARTEQTKTETQYIPQQNTRSWIDTVSHAFGTIASGISNLTGRSKKR